MRNKKSFGLVLLIGASLILLSRCMTAEKNKDPRGELYAGAATCRQCHREIYDSYLKTAHFNTSRPSTDSTVLGSFHAGRNIFDYDSRTRMMMERRDSGL